MKESILDNEELKASRTEASFKEIELFREAEKHYETRLQSGRLGMVFIGYLFLKNVSGHIIGSRSFFIYLILGLFFLIGGYLVKYRPRIILFSGLSVYFILTVISFITYSLPPHGSIVALLFILFAGQSLTVAQKLIIVRQRLSENGEIPRYKQVWY